MGRGSRELVELHHLIVQVRNLEDVEPVANAIDAMLRRFHKKEDFRISIPLALRFLPSVSREAAG